MPPSEFGIEHFVEGVADQDKGEGDDGDRKAGGNDPAPIGGARDDKVVIEDPSPRLNRGIPKAQESEGRMGQY